MYCKYLSKTLQNGFKCKLHKKHIDSLLMCENCLERNVVRNKGIKKVSKKRICVIDKTYREVFDRDKHCCRLCGTSLNLQLHHIQYRSEAKDLINEPKNCIMLCVNCHQLVHSNKHYWQAKLKEITENDIKI